MAAANNSSLEILLEDFRTFRSTGAHGLEWPRKTICAVVRKDERGNIESVIIKRNVWGMIEKHAEEYVVESLNPEGETQIYSNWSPCAECSSSYLHWLQGVGRHAKLRLTFAGLYYIERQSCNDNGCKHHTPSTDREACTDLLRILNGEPNITVKTFEEHDWVDLFQCLHWKLYTEKYEYGYGRETSFEEEDAAMRKDYEHIKSA